MIGTGIGWLNLLACIALLRYAREPLLPVAIALVLTLLLAPLVTAITRWRIPRLAASLGVTLCFGAGILVVAANVISPLERWSAEVPKALAILQQEGGGLSERLQRFSDTSAQVEAIANEVSGERDQPVRVKVEQSNATARAASAAMDVAYAFFISLLCLFFMLTTGPQLVRRAVRLAGTAEAQRRWISVVREVQRGYTRYLVTVSLINVGLGLVTGTMLSLMQVPDAWLWGLLAGGLNFIPYLGTVVSTLAITIAATVSHQELLWMMLPGLSYLLINGIEANLLTPSLLGERLSLNPMFVLLSIVFMGWLWGIGGMFVAVPALVVLKVSMAELNPSPRAWHQILAG